MATQLPTIAVAGGGASGTLAVLHLLAACERRARLVLVERSGALGGGVAFSTPWPCHLLNVPAGGMSAFDDDPADFVRWLDRHGYQGASAEFVPRRLFGQYLRDLLWLAAGNPPGHVFDVVTDEVVAIETGGGRARLVLRSAAAVEADAVVLATGIVARRFPPALAASSARFIADPWAGGALDGIEPSATVALVGTGLTAVDVLLALDARGHGGPVYAVSRHGLLPRPHLPDRGRPSHGITTPAGGGPHALEPGAPGPEALAALDRQARHMGGAQARGLLHQFRHLLGEAAAAGVDWREVVDMLRPVTAELWQGLDDPEKLRFYRHLERLWNVHRHRMAPQAALRTDELLDAGRFHVHAGTIESARPQPDGSLRLQVQLRASRRARLWAADWLINCTGPDPDVFSAGHPLLAAVRAAGLGAPGPLGLGISTDERGRVVGAGGHALAWMWALGSLRQGQLLESTAVPEIRGQAQAIALDASHFLNLRRARPLGPAPQGETVAALLS